MDYQVVFDITTAGYKSWTFPASGLTFVALGVGLVVGRKSFPGWWRNHPRVSSVFAFFFLGFSVFWTAMSFGGTYSQYRHLSSAIETGKFKVAEGTVTNFTPMPVGGHAMERFCVQRACFEYSNFIITGGFNNTSSHGGPIREGLPVRVTYVGNAIVKLEVRR